MDNRVKVRELFPDKYYSELLVRYGQKQHGLMSIAGWKNIFNCSQYIANHYCRPVMLEGATVERKEETSVTESEDSVTVEHKKYYDSVSESAKGEYSSSSSFTLRGTSGKPDKRMPFQYYCPQKGCDQTIPTFSIMNPRPTCQREVCERYGMEMVLKQ